MKFDVALEASVLLFGLAGFCRGNEVLTRKDFENAKHIHPNPEENDRNEEQV